MFDKSGQNRAKTTPADAFESDRYNVDEFYRRKAADQNLPLGIIAGLVAAMVGAVLWALIASTLGVESSVVALVIGFLVGQAVRFFGRGVTISFPVAGALLAVAGCVLGKLLSASAIYAFKHNMEATEVFLNVLSQPDVALRVLMAMTGPLDALFYILAICEAAKLSFRPVVFNEK